MHSLTTPIISFRFLGYSAACFQYVFFPMYCKNIQNDIKHIFLSNLEALKYTKEQAIRKNCKNYKKFFLVYLWRSEARPITHRDSQNVVEHFCQIQIFPSLLRKIYFGWCFKMNFKVKWIILQLALFKRKTSFTFSQLYIGNFWVM